MSFSFDRDIQHAIDTINRLIISTNSNGGKVYITRADDKEFSIELKHPIDIFSYIPMINANGTGDWREMGGLK